MVEYGERLRAAMDDRGVSTQQLADKLGITYQAVKKVIDGKSSALSAANNSRAAKFLRVSSDWLAVGEGGVAAQASTEQLWPFTTFTEDEVRHLPVDAVKEIEDFVRWKIDRSTGEGSKKTA